MYDGGSRYFDGKMDDVWYFSRALSASEILNLKNNFDYSDDFLSITSSHDFSCGIKTDNNMLCWGWNAHGALGVGDTTNRWAPVLVSGDHSWLQMEANSYWSDTYQKSMCALTTDNDAYCWGRNANGEAGNDTTSQQNLPVAVKGSYKWKQISKGAVHSCGVTTDHEGYCWGYNDYGQLGNGTKSQMQVPQLVAGQKKWLMISAGRQNTCGITLDNDAYCWGRDNEGQFGDGAGEFFLTRFQKTW